MLRYIALRCVYAVAVLLCVATIVFFLIRLKGDPATLFLPQMATADDIAVYKAAHGLDKPLPVQYALFMAGVLHGDFGNSLRYGDSSLALVLQHLPATLTLALAAALVGIAIAVPAAVISARHKGHAPDTAAMLGSLLGQSFPQFWLGLMLILLVGVRLKMLPPSGGGGLDHLVLPAVTLGLPVAAVLARLLRANLIDVLGQDYLRTGRAKGLAEWPLLLRHAMKNAALPSMTVFGLQLAALISNAIIVEYVFAWPGIGQLALAAIGLRDFPIVEAFVFVTGGFYAILNLVVDLLYTWLDPRIRLAPA
ncbi:MAG: ABC transporter permease [Chloroflexi bacterium]|nr:ABC transporter permease [Chloroflexota bacterium]